MFDLASSLVFYGSLADPAQGSILSQLASVYDAWGGGSCDEGDKSWLRLEYLAACRRMVQVACEYGLAGSLWHDCLLLELVRSENPLSLAAEGAPNRGLGSLEHLLALDAATIAKLWAWDFEPLEEWLDVTVMSQLEAWRPARGCAVSWLHDAVRAIDAAGATSDAIVSELEHLYAMNGAGTFALSSVVSVRHAVGNDSEDERDIEFVPQELGDRPGLEDLVGYELQKERLVDNTRAFVEGRPANNVLLYGDAGTGKSTSVAALAPAFAESGLRIVELYKHQMRDLPAILERLSSRNLRFIIFIDDLSFEDGEVEYKYLKAVIEGGVAARPANVLVYATSNRRHLIRESWSDRDDMEHDGDVHRSDTMQEKLSLAGRFGLTINYSAPNHQLYHDIVIELAARAGITMPEADLLRAADAWSIRHGGISGRVAAQFVDNLAATGSAP